MENAYATILRTYMNIFEEAKQQFGEAVEMNADLSIGKEPKEFAQLVQRLADVRGTTVLTIPGHVVAINPTFLFYFRHTPSPPSLKCVITVRAKTREFIETIVRTVAVVKEPQPGQRSP